MRSLTSTLVLLLIGCVTLPEELRAADQFVVVVLDDSGSMREGMRNRRGRKMDVAKEALQTVLSDVSDEAEVGVLALNTIVDGSNWIVPLGPVDRATIQQRIGAIRANGSTPLGAAMKDATDALLQAREKQIYGTFRLLIVTDGEASDQNLVDKYLPDIKARGVTTDVIGVDMSGQHSLATQVSTYRRADDPNSLTQAIAQVFAETSDQDDTAGESDYDLLGGIPEEVAAAAVESLTRMNNQPIGEVAIAASVAPGFPPSVAPTPATPAPGSGRPVTVPAQSSGGGGLAMGTVCVGVFFLMIAVVVFLAMASQVGRKRSR